MEKKGTFLNQKVASPHFHLGLPRPDKSGLAMTEKEAGGGGTKDGFPLSRE